MNKNLTEMVFILDRSGSMACLEDDTIGGYNSLIEKHRNDENEVIITTVLFDTQYNMIHDNENIKCIEPMTKREYYARGNTALYDAIGKTIKYINHKNDLKSKENLPSKTMVVIITDGYENASKMYNGMQIKRMICEQKKIYGWEFVFLGANIDAEEYASDIGIEPNRSVTYKADSRGTQINFECLSDAFSCFCKEGRVGSKWKNKISQYTKEVEKSDK
jgi:uncharacterized protein YegL